MFYTISPCIFFKRVYVFVCIWVYTTSQQKTTVPILSLDTEILYKVSPSCNPGSEVPFNDIILSHRDL